MAKPTNRPKDDMASSFWLILGLACGKMRTMKASGYEEWEKEISSCIISGRVVFTDHAFKRMGLRGYTTEDVLCILEYGKIVKITKIMKESCRCRVEGKDTEGDHGSVVAEIIKTKKIIVITVLGGA